MRFINDDKVEVAPNEVLKINVAGRTGITGEIGVVEDFVIETVGSEDVATIVRGVECPVIPQALRTEDENSVAAQLSASWNCATAPVSII